MPGSWVCSACAKRKIGCTQLGMPQQRKRKSQLFIELDVEGDWVHWIKRLWIDKGKGWMGTVDSELDNEEAQVRYWADVHHLVESSEVVARSFKALVLLLVEWLPVPISGNPESRSVRFLHFIKVLTNHNRTVTRYI